ncbi:MAG: hypothetical protein K1W33_02895, partial [Clostridia bacterium]
KVETEEIVNKIVLKLEDNRKKIENSSIFNKEYKDIIDEIFLNCKEIVGGDIETILTLYENLISRYPNYLIEINDIESNASQKKFNTYISKIFNYDSIKYRKFLFDLIEKIDVEICPYCNRNYVTVINTRTRKKRPQLDHFFPKSLFPLLSVSIANLIPSCSYCNQLKSDRFFPLSDNIYPYNEGIEDISYFNYKYGKSLKEINVVLNKGINKKMDKNAEYLAIEELYKTHKNIVKDIIDKSKIY